MATKKEQPAEDPAVAEALAATEAGETLDEQYDAIVQAGEDLAAEDATEAPTGTEDDVVLTESAPELTDPRAAEREEWIAANPDASVIPHDLLPPDFQDGTIITPGLP